MVKQAARSPSIGRKSDGDAATDRPDETVVLPSASRLAARQGRSVRNVAATTEWTNGELERKYDLTPLGHTASRRGRTATAPSSYSIDPYEFTADQQEQMEHEQMLAKSVQA
jgi:hypothetical protein